jgi:CTP synthase
MLGKYVNYEDSYKSLNEALVHGGIANDVRVNFHWVEAEEVEGGHAAELLEGVDGLLVPGGFGERGIQGMIEGIQWAREEGLPFFGICLGMQCAVIEWARNRAGLRGAHSSEFDETTGHRVIVMQKELEGLDLGGTMRLGAYPCVLAPGTKAQQAYDADLVQERHRHRYEVNPAYLEALEESGLVVSGHSPERLFVEIIEDPDHPWFLACQFHPEFKSRPLAPHPLFREFIQAAYVRKRQSGSGEEAEAAPVDKPTPFDQTG